jgi:glutathione S-transferase
VRLILTHKDAAYTFRDLEPEMGSPVHLALHPFDRVPILQHGDFTLYETSAIVAYLEEVFPTPSLQPKTAQDRARMNQWISAVNSYYYPYMIYHVSHERNVFPQLGIAPDEKVVAHALPKIEIALHVMERQLAHGQGFLLGSEMCLADYYLLPSTYAFGLAPEGKAMYADFPRSRNGGRGWRRCRPLSAFAPPSPRALRSSTPANGRFRTVRNTDPTRRCRSATRPRLLAQGSEAELEFALTPSMHRTLAWRAAQSLGGYRLTGSLPFPLTGYLVRNRSDDKYIRLTPPSLRTAVKVSAVPRVP